jgi:outer membrane lipoprotein-sorting protein
MTEPTQLPQDLDEEIDRAVQAVRSTSPSRELPPDVRAGLVATMQTAAHGADPLGALRRLLAPAPRGTLLAAASVLITVAAVAVAVAMLGGGKVAFAEVKAAIQRAQTVAMTAETTVGQGPNAITLRMMMRIKAPGLVRMETASGESVVADAAQKMMLTVEPARRRAMLIDIPELPDRGEASHTTILDKVRQTLDGSQTPLGRREVEGRLARGFIVSKDNREMEIWVDESTGDILLIRMNVHMEGMPRTTVTLRNIFLNAEMPDELFRLVPPEGFTLENHAKNLGTPGEQDLAEGLRDLAGWSGGVFPEQLQPSVEMAKTIEANLATLEPGDKTTKVHRLTRMVFFAGLRYDQDFHYAGGGVKLGDATKPIAWWRPKGAAAYRVLMGDLTFRDSPADQLPSTGPASRPATSCRPRPADQGPVQITCFDNEAGELARVSDLITEMALTVSASTRATEGCPTGFGSTVTRTHADGRIEDVTRRTPTGG